MNGDGITDTVWPVVALNPSAGDQVKALPPVAVNTVLVPVQMEISGPALAVRVWATFIVTLSVVMQPLGGSVEVRV